MTLREAAELLLRSQYSDCVEVATAYLAEHKADEDDPLTDEWLYSVGFSDDRTGTPTIGPLHIQHKLLVSKCGIRYEPYACIRSVPIPVPQTRGDVRILCSAIGITLKEGTT